MKRNYDGHGEMALLLAVDNEVVQAVEQEGRFGIVEVLLLSVEAVGAGQGVWSVFYRILTHSLWWYKSLTT